MEASKRIRVVLTHPYCWPYVRRGSERNMDILGRYLTRRGHQVVTVSTKPGGAAVEETEAGRRILQAPLVFPGMSLLRLQTTHTFFFPCRSALRNLEADVVHSFFYSDALAASLARGSPPCRTVYQLNGVGIPGVSCYRWLPPEGWMLEQAIHRADAPIACSDFVRDLVRQHYRREIAVIRPPVDIDSWPLGGGPPDGRPTILSVANFDVRSKGVRILVQAFCQVKSRVPAALLRLSGHMSAAVQTEILRDLPDSVRSGIEILGLGKSEDLPRLYREASIMVLPSMGEPSGGALLESLASGTPVVVTRHGGMPEFVDPQVGVLFDPRSDGPEAKNEEGLVEAILEGLSLSEGQGIRDRCRAHAQKFSAQAQGPLYEELYAGVN